MIAQFVEHVVGLAIEDLGIKHGTIEFFITLIEQAPKLVDGRLDLLSKVTDCVFKMMLEVDSEVDESGLYPKEGF
ncbi:MAG: hypothetical protein V2I33_25055 [Kangiellaceae bacterium]|nr:hypothetical protein [Kangiellaceae bacterium]